MFCGRGILKTNQTIKMKTILNLYFNVFHVKLRLHCISVYESLKRLLVTGLELLLTALST
jgi:hypothetical protein